MRRARDPGICPLIRPPPGSPLTPRGSRALVCIRFVGNCHLARPLQWSLAHAEGRNTMRSSLAPRMDLDDATTEMTLRAITSLPKAPSAITNTEIAPYMSLVHEEVRRMLRRLP